MRFHRWFRDRLSHRRPRPVARSRPAGRARLRPFLEQFEDRQLLASYTAASVKDLINDINAANARGGSNTIMLVANTTFDLTKVVSTIDGPTGLPVITNNDSLTVVGQAGDILQRDPSAVPFRLFDVATGAALTLNTLALQHGFAFGTGSSAQGGATYNQGSLVLNGVILQYNDAQGNLGSPAEGGAIFNQGSLILNGGSLQNNLATGGVSSGSSAEGGAIYNRGSLTVSGVMIEHNGATGGLGAAGTKRNPTGGNAQDAAGGGIWSNGTLMLESGTAVQNNYASGGAGGSAYYSTEYPGAFGGNAGGGYGGGVFIAGGTAALEGAALSGNQAHGGNGGAGGFVPFGGDDAGGGGAAFGGGVYITASSTVTLCSDAIQSNTATPGSGGVLQLVGAGGGIYIEPGATVYIDSSTVTNTTNNTPDNIEGTYVLQNC
jgi:hypothetical protein